jgi:hypothetical protein
LLPLLLSCLNGYLLRLTLACETDTLWATGFIYRKHNREDSILEFRLNIVDIDRPGEGDRPFKRPGRNFLQEPVVTLLVAVRSALLAIASLLWLPNWRLTCLRLLLALPLTLLLALRLTLLLFPMLVLITIATSNCQGVLINRDFDVFWPHSWESNIYLIAIRRFTDIHRCYHRCYTWQHTGVHEALVK